MKNTPPTLAPRQSWEFPKGGKLGEIMFRSLILGTRSIAKGIIKSCSPEKIPNSGKPILYIDSTTWFNGMGNGDTVGRTPVLEAIAHYYKVRVDVLCSHDKYPIFKGTVGLGEVFSWKEGIRTHFELLHLLRAQEYGAVMLIKPDISYFKYWSLLSPLPKIILKQGRVANTNRTEALYQSAIDQGFLSMPEGGVPAPSLSREATSLSKIPHRPGVKRCIIHTEAASALRSYGDWRGIIADMHRIYGGMIEIILVGEGNQSQIHSGVKTHDLRGQTPSLQDVMNELREADIFIGADGGVAHIAMALGIPTINIASVSPYSEFVQPGKQQHVIPIQAPCPQGSPCGINLSSRGRRCLVTNQSYKDHSRSPPCMTAHSLRGEIITSLQRIIPVSSPK